MPGKKKNLKKQKYKSDLVDNNFMPDLEKGMKGEIPWSFEDFKKMSEWYHNLMQKPKDDWDLKEAGLVMEDEGCSSKLTINKTIPETQVMFYMMGEYGPKVASIQFHRFYKIVNFIIKHREKLESDKQNIKGKSFDMVRTEFVMALCVLPFSDKSDSDYFDFDYNEVVKKADEIAEELKDSE